MAGEPQLEVVLAHGKAAARTALTKALADEGIGVVASLDRAEDVPAALNRFHPDAVILATELTGSVAIEQALQVIARVLPEAKRVVVGRGAKAVEDHADATVPDAKPAEVVVAVRNLFGRATTSRRRTRTGAAARA